MFIGNEIVIMPDQKVRVTPMPSFMKIFISLYGLCSRYRFDLLRIGMALKVSMNPQIFSCKDDIIWRGLLETSS